MAARVTFLGTGDTYNAGSRGHASYFVTTPDARFLLDCGATALQGLKREGFAALDLDAILLSHLHGDHFAGIVFFFLAFLYETPRQRPLTLVGPPGTERRVRDLFQAMYHDLASRPLPFRLDFVEVQPGARTEIGAIDLLPFRVPHQKSEVSLGFRVNVDGKTILYSGDTGWTDDLVTHSQDTDLFICECCSFETRVDFHLDYPRIAENAPRFGCRRLVLTHLGREVLTRRNEVTLELAHDGLAIEL